MSIKDRIIKILIFPFPVLNDLDRKIIRGLLLFITNPFMKYHNVLKILNKCHLVYRPTGAKQYPPLLRKGGGGAYILYPEFLALLTQYLCQRLTVLQESCKMAKFLQYNKLATSVVKNTFKYINN
jgi:hypothetical protein